MRHNQCLSTSVMNLSQAALSWAEHMVAFLKESNMLDAIDIVTTLMSIVGWDCQYG